MAAAKNRLPETRQAMMKIQRFNRSLAFERNLRVSLSSMLSALFALSLACSSPTGPDTPATERTPRIASIQVAPGSAELEVRESRRFTADVRDVNGNPVDVAIEWRATGGSIDAGGNYVAGTSAGLYEVRATGLGELIGIARVRIDAASDGSNDGSTTGQDSGDATDAGDDTNDEGDQAGSDPDGSPDSTGSTGSSPSPAPQPETLELSPDFVEISVGTRVTFQATLRDASGSTIDGTVTFETPGGGGTITADGVFTAGSQVGDFQVIARSGNLRASSIVRVSDPSASSGDDTGDDGETQDDTGQDGSDSEDPPPQDPPPSSTDVTIRPGESIQAAVDAHSPGTSFTIAAGVHRRQSIEPRDGMTFVGEAGAVLDGENSVRYAFHGKAADVTIRGLEIRNYANPAQIGAIHAGGHSKSDGSEGWLIQDNEVHHNAGVGIRIGNRTVVRNNHVHHNQQLGIGGVGDDVLVEGNEISYNNWQKQYSYGWEAGGTKFVKTRNLVVRNNHSHHNWGPGLWTDIDNIDSLIEGNVVEDNADTGIFHEISYAAVIRNNTVRNNGWDKAAWAYGAGILVAHSPDVQVVGNVLENNYNGIMGVQQDRGSGAHGPYELRNLEVRDNRVTQHTGQWAAGTVQDIGDKGVFDRNISFDGNHYDLGLDKPFAWDNDHLRPGEWQAFGHDMSGSF